MCASWRSGGFGSFVRRKNLGGLALSSGWRRDPVTVSQWPWCKAFCTDSLVTLG